MKLISKLTLRYISKNKFRTMLTLLGIIISISMIVSVGILYNSLEYTLIQGSIDFQGNYDFQVVNPTQEDKLTLTKFKDIKNTYKISNNDIGRYYQEEEYGYDRFIGFNIYGMDNEYFNVIKPQKILIEGNMPKNPNEIIVPYDLKNVIDEFSQLGNEIELNVYSKISETDDPNSLYYLKDGLVDSSNSNNLDRLANYNELSEIFNKTESKRKYKIVGYHGYDTFSISQEEKDKGEKIEYILQTSDIFTYDDKFENKYSILGQFTSYDNLEYNREIAKKSNIFFNESLIDLKNLEINENINLLPSFTIILTVTIAVAVIIFIYNIFVSNYVERLHDLGLLKISGFTNSQLFKMILLDSLFYVVTALPLGFLVSHIAMTFTLNYVNKMLTQVQLVNELFFFVRYGKFMIWFTIIVSLLIIFISNFLSALFVFNKTPIEALNSISTRKEKKYKPKKRRLIKKLFGYEGFLASRNIDRNKNRFIMTTISITMSIVLFVIMAQLFKYAESDLSNLLVENEKQDLILNTDYKRSKFVEEDLNKIDGIDILTKSEFIRTNYGLYDKTLDDISEYLNIISFSDEYFEKEFGDKDNYIMFETMNLKNNDYNIEKDGNYNINIIGTKTLYDEEGFETKIENQKSTKDIINLRVIKKEDKNYRNYSFLVIITKESLKEDLLKKISSLPYTVEYRYEILRNKYDIETSYNLQGLTTKYPNTYTIPKIKPIYNVLKLFVYGFIFIVISISAINIINSVYTNIYTRKKEIALIETIGIEKRKLKKIILLENMFSIVLAGIYSFVISSIIIFMLYISTYDTLSLDNAKKLVGEFSLPLLNWLFAMLVTSVLIYIFITIPYNIIMKKNVTDILK